MGETWKRNRPAEPAGGGFPLPAELPAPRLAPAVFILGLLGCVVGCLPFGPIGLFLAAGQRRAVREGRAAKSGLLTAGWILSLIGTVFFAIAAVYAAVSALGAMAVSPEPGGT